MKNLFVFIVKIYFNYYMYSLLKNCRSAVSLIFGQEQDERLESSRRSSTKPSLGHSSHISFSKTPQNDCCSWEARQRGR